ncbi:ComF family protein [Comamonadaceae bacterium M7527]|nr:ComF family protein [Comamonadaceae bacterium M7527]
MAPTGADSANTVGIYRCAACSTSPPAWQSAHAAVDYAFPWASLIAQFKYQRHTALARPLAGLIANSPNCNATLRQADVWLGVPIARHKLGTRGFNQTHLLLDQLANRLSDCAGAHHWHRSKAFATRSQQLASQMGLGRAQRLRNLGSVFALSQQGAAGLRAKHVLLVDDVYTTGATLMALASVVQQAKPASLHVCVLARTPAVHAHNEH